MSEVWLVVRKAGNGTDLVSAWVTKELAIREARYRAKKDRARIDYDSAYRFKDELDGPAQTLTCFPRHDTGKLFRFIVKAMPLQGSAIDRLADVAK